MAKVLITSNFHPNEAFAISVAREISRELRELGHEVVERKFKFDETSLGKAMKSEKPMDAGDLIETDREQRALLNKIIAEVRPDFAFDVHTTPYDITGQDKYSKMKWGTSDPTDEFPMERDYFPTFCFDIAKHRSIEVKAVYKPFPELFPEKINLEPLTRDVTKKETYFTETTCQKLTREQGLHPEIYGKTIAQHIDTLIKKGCIEPADFDELQGKVKKPLKRPIKQK